MNIFNKVSLQSMKKSRTRTIVTIIGVALAATMITAVATFAVSMQNFMIKDAIQKSGSWHVGFLNADSSFVHERALDKEVANTAAFQNIGYAKFKGLKTADKPYFFIAGFNKKTFDTLPIILSSGRLPKNSGEIVVPMSVEAKGDVRLAVGDRLSLTVGKRMEGNKNLDQHDLYISGNKPGTVKETLVTKAKKNYTVVGFCEKLGFEDSYAPGYTLITSADAADKEDNFSVFVTLKNPRGVHAYTKSTAGTHSYVFNDDLLKFMGLSGGNVLLYSVGGILIALIMIGSVFLIYNSFNISMNERTQQFAILSSVGATPKQLKNVVLFEGLCIGAIGIPIGVALGIGSIRLVISVVAEKLSIFNNSLHLTLIVSAPAIVAAAVISMVTILISAYIPARKAANTPVIESLRQTNDVKIESKAVKTSKLAERIYGLEGILALKNFKRNKKRYRSIVLSLVFSIVLFVSTSTFGTNLKHVMEKTAVNTDYDICFLTQDMDKSKLFSLYDKFKTAHGIYKSSYQALMTYSCVVKTNTFSDSYRKSAGYNMQDKTINMPMDIQFIRDSEYLSFIKDLDLPVKEYTGQNAKMIAVGKDVKKYNTKDGKSGDKIIDMFASRSMNFTIAPQINDKPKMEQRRNINVKFVDTDPTDTLPARSSGKMKSYAFRVIAPYKLLGKFKTPGTNADMGLTFKSNNPSKSVAEMKAMIKSEKITSWYTLYNFCELLEQSNNLLFITNVFLYVFVIMISLIATANVFNTISTNIKLRRRELAMLRSVGMSDRDFQKMMNFECIFYGMKALFFGLPISAILSWLIYKLMVMGGGPDTGFTFPWSSMGISVLSVFVIVFVTMMYSISKIKKENIIDALRED